MSLFTDKESEVQGSHITVLVKVTEESSPATEVGCDLGEVTLGEGRNT